MLPKIGMALTMENVENAKDLIEECLTNPKFKETREQARDEIWQHRGEGAVRVADYLCNKLKELNEKEAAELKAAESKSGKKKAKKADKTEPEKKAEKEPEAKA